MTTQISSLSESDIIDPTRPNWMEIDLQALDNNYRLLRSQLAPGVRLHASVKSSAYGLNVSEIAKRLVALGAEAICCGSFDDALAVRQAGLLDVEIVMFASTLPSGIPRLLEHNLIPSVHNRELAEAVSENTWRPYNIYTKVDCGWGRVGFPLKGARDAILSIAKMKNLVIEGVYTHLPFTDPEGAKWAQERTSRFDDLIDQLRRDGLEIPITQARSSSGVLFGIEDRCNAVAPGSVLYGKPSLSDGVLDFTDFKSVLTSIKTSLIHVAPNASDKTPGVYGRFADRVRGSTGVIPFGRRDGNRAPRQGQTPYMIVKGVCAPVLSVSSELAILDLSNVPQPRVGDEVVILGRSGDEIVTLADLARWQDTGMNDILLMMRGRMPQLLRY